MCETIPRDKPKQFVAWLFVVLAHLVNQCLKPIQTVLERYVSVTYSFELLRLFCRWVACLCLYVCWRWCGGVLVNHDVGVLRVVVHMRALLDACCAMEWVCNFVVTLHPVAQLYHIALLGGEIKVVGILQGEQYIKVVLQLPVGSVSACIRGEVRWADEEADIGLFVPLCEQVAVVLMHDDESVQVAVRIEVGLSDIVIEGFFRKVLQRGGVLHGEEQR